MNLFKVSLLCSIFFTAVFYTNIVYAKSIKVHHDPILGTSFDLLMDVDPASAKRVELAVLAEITRLEKILSSYSSNSEISILNNKDALTKKSKPLSPELIEILVACEEWRSRFPKSFSCRMGKIHEHWNKSVLNQSVPDRKRVRNIARAAAEGSVNIETNKNITFDKSISWEASAIAKGYIIDKALTVARSTAPHAKQLVIDIGGDSRHWAFDDKLLAVNLALPGKADDSHAVNAGQVSIGNQAIAYSGHDARSMKIGRREFSHILQPRDGWPVDVSHAVVVTAPTALVADAWATTLAASNISESIKKVNAQRDVEALILSSDGRLYPSKNWRTNFIHKDKVLNNKVTAHINFAIEKPKTGNYQRPYVALWIENKSRKVIKNLLLFGQSEQWMSKNSYWWRRQGRKSPLLLEGFAQASRRPGQYQTTWFGDDDYGHIVKDGQYTLNLEVTREHGDHEKQSITFELGDKPTEVVKKGLKEISSVSLTLLP